LELHRLIDYASELNDQQLAVVTAGRGPLLVIAGAGSGKTRTLTYRVAHLIETGIDPHRILLLTFTNKAAREMLHRVETLTPYTATRIWGGTFHHIANRILRVHGERVGLTHSFTILDQSDAYSILDATMLELGHKKKDGVIPQGGVLFSILSLARNTRIDIERVLQERYPFFLEYTGEIEKIHSCYTERKRRQNLADFDDLLCLWLELMESNENLRNFYADRFEHILVDEYQDTNRLQADLIDTLAERHRNLMVVGDDSQSIYSFRGANFENIMAFPERYPDARIIKLEYNYRSTPEILGLANESILLNARQFRKVLQPMRQQGAEPVCVRPGDVYEQAQFVASTIQELIYNGTPPGEIAVLYRAHYHSMELQMELTRRLVPFEVRSGLRFFEQAHIKDIVSYLKVLVNPHDEAAWKRILQLLPGIGAKTSDKIYSRMLASADPLETCIDAKMEAIVPKGARPYWGGLRQMLAELSQTGKEVSPAALIKTALESGYRDYMRSKYMDADSRSDDIEQFLSFAGQYESLADFLSELALMTSTETEDVQAGGLPTETIKLTTIHQAKGLEWSVVFLIWLVEGRFPNPNNFTSLDDEEEERRLFYVAVTRGKDRLFLCSPRRQKESTGYLSSLKPSRFLRELPDACYRQVGTSDYYEF
jgi:DNA helicase II / ATP-dependent DNA helicase PcrA